MELKGRHFTRVADFSAEELVAVLDLADDLKQRLKRKETHFLLPGRAVGMVFEKPSLRTRVSFEVGIGDLGATPINLSGSEIGIGERESTRDLAIVLSRYLDALVVRTFAQKHVDDLAEHGTIPIVNALTDDSHPCQALADAMTIRERFGGFDGVRVAYVGDGNNVCASLMVICAKLGMEFVAATPPGYEPSGPALEAARAAGGSPSVVNDPREAARGAHVVYTDVWTSMGQEDERLQRLRDFAGFQIDDALMSEADDSGVVLHCLPAHYGEEIGEDMLHGPRSAAWDQAENRMHAQKALLALIVP